VVDDGERVGGGAANRGGRGPDLGEGQIGERSELRGLAGRGVVGVGGRRWARHRGGGGGHGARRGRGGSDGGGAGLRGEGGGDAEGAGEGGRAGGAVGPEDEPGRRRVIHLHAGRGRRPGVRHHDGVDDVRPWERGGRPVLRDREVRRGRQVVGVGVLVVRG